MTRQLIGLSIALLLAGCASAPVALEVDDLAGKGAYAPSPFITVLNSAPIGTYVPIAQIVATGSAGITRTQILAALQDKAEKLGANAIIVQDQSEVLTPDITANPAGGQYSIPTPTTLPKFTGLAIHMENSDTTGN